MTSHHYPNPNNDYKDPLDDITKCKTSITYISKRKRRSFIFQLGVLALSFITASMSPKLSQLLTYETLTKSPIDHDVPRFSVPMGGEMMKFGIVNLHNESILLKSCEVNGEGHEIEIDAGEMLAVTVEIGTVWNVTNPDTNEVHFRIMANKNLCGYIHLHMDQDARDGAQKYCEENGRPWLNVWPPEPPVHSIIESGKLGSTRDISTNIIHANGPPGLLDLKLKTLSLYPKVFSIDGFLNDEECDHIIASANGSFARSEVMSEEGISDVRTSSTAWMDIKHDDTIRRVSHRIFDVLGLDFSKSARYLKDMQVLRYLEGEQYKPHYDYFQPFVEVEGRSNRFVTAFLQLSNVDGGGETVFPMAGRGVASSEPCKTDFRVAPQKGRLLIFYHMLECGNLDIYSLHGGCPVQGDLPKYAANLWIWSPLYDPL